jgi:peptide deformylase
MIRKILPTTNSKLRVKSKKVSKIDKKVLALIQDLKDTLLVQKDPEGIGLAAPQIGKNLRVFIADYKDFKRVVVNPEIVSESKKTHLTKASKDKEVMEGCLSLPNYYGPLKRSDWIRVKYLNENGEEIVETFRGFDAQIILHEIDHLEGVLFVDRLLQNKKPLYKVDGNSWEEVELT